MLSHLLWGDYQLTFYPPHKHMLRLWQALCWMGKRKKMVTPIEGPIGYLDEKDLRFIRKKVLLKSSFVVPVTEYVKNDLKSETGFETNTIIPVGVDTDFFFPIARTGKTITKVLTIGRYTQRKGQEILLEIAEMIRGVEFRIVGNTCSQDDSEFLCRLKDHAIKRELTNVEFIGRVSQEKIRELMWDSDILLHPSRIESISKVALEASATGLPCVLFADYDTPAVIDSVTGFKVRTFEEMVLRLQELIGDADLRQKFGNAGREHAKKFNWSGIVREWEDLFERIANEGDVA